MSIESFKSLKGKKKITALTCYDFFSAVILDELDLDLILVGDSLAMVMLGHDDTRHITFAEMLPFARAVKTAIKSDKLIVFDMPSGSYDDPKTAFKNVELLKAETGIEIVKIEGRPDIVRFLVDKGVEVMGHAGLKPQTTNVYKPADPKKTFEEAMEIARAGAFAIVLECVKTDTAQEISRKVDVPVIGIGAGKGCDGQILVLHDMLGLYDRFKPKFVRKYADLKQELQRAVTNYIVDVRKGDFPSEKESY